MNTNGRESQAMNAGAAMQPSVRVTELDDGALAVALLSTLDS